MNKSLLFSGIATLAVGLFVIIIVEAYFSPGVICQCPAVVGVATVTCSCPSVQSIFPALLLGLIVALVGGSTSLIALVRS